MENLTKDLRHIIVDNKLNDGVNTSLYDYVATNYYKMSKEELKELILNLNYAIYKNLSKKEYLNLENQAIEDTIERLMY